MTSSRLYFLFLLLCVLCVEKTINIREKFLLFFNISTTQNRFLILHFFTRNQSQSRFFEIFVVVPVRCNGIWNDRVVLITVWGIRPKFGMMKTRSFLKQERRRRNKNEINETWDFRDYEILTRKGIENGIRNINGSRNMISSSSSSILLREKSLEFIVWWIFSLFFSSVEIDFVFGYFPLRTHFADDYFSVKKKGEKRRTKSINLVEVITFA